MYKGESFSIEIAFNAEYDINRIQDLILLVDRTIIGRLTEGTISKVSGQFRCALTSIETNNLEIGKQLPVTLVIDDANSGVIKKVVYNLDIERSKSVFENDSENTGTNLVIDVTFTNTVQTTSVTVTAALNAVNMTEYALKSFAENPENIIQTPNYRFISDSEKTDWNNKSGIIFGSTEPNTITTTAESSLLGSVGRSTVSVVRQFDANSLIVGNYIRIKIKGLFSTTSGASAHLRVKLGNTILSDIIETFSNNRVNYWFEKEIDIAIEAIGVNGSVRVAGRSLAQNSTGLDVLMIPVNPLNSVVTANLSINNIVDVTFQWAATGSSITKHTATVDLL